MEETERLLKSGVLGLEIFFVCNSYEQDPETLNIRNAVSLQDISSNYALLIPKNSLFLRFYIDEFGKTYVYYQNNIFMAQPNYQMHEIMPKNSVLEAIFYIDKNQNPIAGLYDAKVLNDTTIDNEPVINRHIQLVENLYKTNDRVTNHWVGHAWICVKEWNRKQLPFECDAILIFEKEGLEKSTYLLEQLID